MNFYYKLDVNIFERHELLEKQTGDFLEIWDKIKTKFEKYVILVI